MDILAKTKLIRQTLSRLYNRKKITITEGMYLSRLLNEIEYELRHPSKPKKPWYRRL